ncbi:GNAT family N-acetyltransferase [Jannaschia formosa]|uniref:GNAT family N-acetyltransferase n=1 Tax=Jannaschia formosa TaxID=2259592 RepID=UPI000E1C222A|nr:GNAT family N-acetyltransferase [Jannaschia formosa]TFL18703.1 N-acetyltransferase [Jannaschia formosa]
MRADIPVLTTKRLILRAPEPQDYPDFKATFASYRSRFMGGPLTPYEAWMLYAAEIGHWDIRGFGMWMVHARADDRTLGMAGGWQPAGWPERELAWIIWPQEAGKGYALESTDAVRRYFYAHGWEGAVSYVGSRNLDSIRLCERLGAKRDRDAPTIADDDLVYRHPGPAELKDTRLSWAIAREIAHYADPKLSPEGMPVD